MPFNAKSAHIVLHQMKPILLNGLLLYGNEAKTEMIEVSHETWVYHYMRNEAKTEAMELYYYHYDFPPSKEEMSKKQLENLYYDFSL